MDAFITADQRALRDEVDALLARIQARLEGWEARPAESARIAQARAGLAELFLLVVTGEFNAGKSRLINALLGGSFLEEGVTPTTQDVQVLVHGSPAVRRAEAGYLVRSLDAEILRDLHVVDTPGTNAIIRAHEALTRDFVPRADLILFVSSADRPFSESERLFLERIRQWGKSIVFILNKADLLRTEGERTQVLEFVRAAARELIGGQPLVFLVSAWQALEAMERGDDDALAASGWPELAGWITRALGEAERLRLKLDSPLGVAEAVLLEATQEVDRRKGVLAQDAAQLTAIASELAAFRADTDAQLASRLDGVDRHLMQIRERGEVFLDENFRLARLPGLLRGENLRERFEAEVIGPAPAQIQDQIDQLVDWFVDQEFRAAHGLEAGLRRLSEGGGEVDSAAAPGFAARRRAMIDRVSGEAAGTMTDLGSLGEGRRVATEIQDTLTKAGLAEAGAIGLGLLLALTKTVAVFDVTGGLIAGSLAVFGLTLLPQRRRQAGIKLRERVDTLRADLRRTLEEALGRDMATAQARMTASFEPYGRFVTAELDRLTELGGALTGYGAEVSALRERIGAEAPR